MVTEESKSHALPDIGLPDARYARLISQAEQSGDTILRSSAKVGRYVTLALNMDIRWEEKLRYFTHCLRNHCATPSLDPEVHAFYQQLADLVRTHCGAEALRLASQEDDMYAARVALGQDRTGIEEDAEKFFATLLGSESKCPVHFSEADWAQLKLIRDQWI